MSDLVKFLILFAPPIWFPLLRSLFRVFLKCPIPKVATWNYAISFAWATGWCLLQWEIKVPSGIGYGLALVTAWPFLLVGIVTDTYVLLRRVL